MRAITVEPKQPGTAKWEEVPEPDLHDGSVLVETIAVGVCGTDVEIVEGKCGWAPPGKTRLVLGHESLGRVLESGPTGGLKKGDLVVGIVRRPDPVPCPNCAVGEWDMCRNGEYPERGIKQIDGFMSERWRIEPEYTIKVDSSLGILGVLLEPTTVVTKAWEQVTAIGQRAFWEPRHVLVTGAGPIGLLAALLGVQRGLDVHVLDRVELGTQARPRACSRCDLPFRNCCHYRFSSRCHHRVHWRRIGDFRLNTGDRVGWNRLSYRRGQWWPQYWTYRRCRGGGGAEEQCCCRQCQRHQEAWYKAGEALAYADRSWLARLITRRERPENFASALQRKADDIKVVVQFAEA
jgi:glucose 1-dehydrogenase